MSARPGSAPQVRPVFSPVADHALLVGLGAEIGADSARAVLALDRALTAHPPLALDHALTTHPPEGLVEVVPALVNLLVEFDPLVTDHARMQAAVEALLAHPDDSAQAPRLHEVPVCYDADLGPDLAMTPIWARIWARWPRQPGKALTA